MPRLQERLRSLDAANEVTIAVEGDLYRGWEALTIVRSLDALAGGFELRCSPVNPFPIVPGAHVVIYIGDDQVLDGYVDSLEAQSSATSTSRTIQGRDRTSDIVDCHVEIPGGELQYVFIRDIAEAVAQPFGVEVSPQFIPARRLFESHEVRNGETGWDVLERAIRLRGLLAFTNGRGQLVIDEPGVDSAEVDLVEGERGNVLASRVSIRRQSRFSTYIVRGQRAGSDTESGLLVAQPEGRAIDTEIRRNRPLVVVAEGPIAEADAILRAEWEATWRAAKSDTLSVDVQGWRQTRFGPLWEINRKVRAVIPSQQVDADYLINSVRLSKDGQPGARGSIATLELVREDAYTPKPEVDPDRAAFQALLEEAAQAAAEEDE